jgi:prepilin-type N-terminal cleavage/methylation domain-containing protein/prepilin-type processing-associated H-X9-DG protein
MQPRHPFTNKNAFTLIELLTVVAIISILASMLLPTLSRAKEQAMRIKCVSNQHQVSLALKMWGDDNRFHYPWATPVSSGGSQGSCLTWQHFMAAQAEMETPRVLVCPSDSGRDAAFAWLGTNNDKSVTWNGNYAVSYFVGLDASDNRPQMHLLGDRNVTGLELQDCPPTGVSNVVTWLMPTNLPGWDMSIHRNVGNIALADGSVSRFGASGLRNHCVSAATETHANCALKPDFTTG